MLTGTDRSEQYDVSEGYAATYAIPFTYFATSEIIAVLTPDSGADVTLTTTIDYTVSAAGATGTLTVVTDWDTLLTGGATEFVRLTIYRVIAQTQDTNYAQGATLDAPTLMRTLDRTVGMVQEVSEESGRKVTVPITDESAADLLLPGASERASRFLACDANGDIIAAVALDTSAITVTTFAETILDDENAVEMLATLGINATGAEINLVADKSANTKVISQTDYTILDGDGFLVFLIETGSANRTITLPTAADNGRRILHFVCTDPDTSGDIIIDGEGAEEIEGATTLTLERSASIICDGTEWHLLNNDLLNFGVTATAAEINTVADGIEATAAEINTVADGIKVTADMLNAFTTGRKIGLDLYYVSSQSLRVRAGMIHLNNGTDDYWVTKAAETTIDDNTENWPANGAWSHVMIDYLGEITLVDATGAANDRPSDAFYQWGEYGGAGFDHDRLGYYFGNLRCIGAIHKVSDTSYYFINQRNGSDEDGTNTRGSWLRVGIDQTTSDIANSGTITLPVSYLSGGGVVGHGFTVTANAQTTGRAVQCIPASVSTFTSVRFITTTAGPEAGLINWVAMGIWR